jgi:hypothetical protein
MEISKLSASARRDRFNYWVGQYDRAVSLTDKETVRVKFYDAFRHENFGVAKPANRNLRPGEGFNTRMSANLRVLRARATDIMTAVDEAFMQTMKGLFGMPTLNAKPKYRGRSR